MAGKFSALFDDDEPAPVEVVDAGPAARRAAAGMPPEAGTVDPDPDGPVTAEGRAGGMYYGNAFNPKAKPQTGTAPGPSFLEADPAGVVAAPLGMAGKLMTPAVARAVGPVVAPVVTGAAAGGATGAATGDPSQIGPGAFMGALAPGFRAVAGGIGEAEAKAMHARGDSRLYRELGQSTAQGSKLQKDLQRLGHERVGTVGREIGLPHAPDKRVPVANELKATGAAMGDILQSADAAGHARDLAAVTRAVDEAHADITRRRGRLVGERLAPVFEEEKRAIFDAFRNDSGSGAKVPLTELHRAITNLESAGFAGKSGQALSDSAKPLVSRSIAQALNRELDAGLTIAGSSPDLGPAVTRFHGLSSRYRTLKALEPIVERMESKNEFGKPKTARGLTAFQATRNAVGNAVGAIPRAGDALGRAVGSRMAGEASDAVVLSPVIYSGVRERNQEKLQAALAAELFPK